MANQQVPAPAAEPSSVTQADARLRALRTFIQGLLFDLLVAAVVFLYPVVTNATTLGEVQWAVVGTSLLKTVAITILSYLMRALKIAPSTQRP